MADREPGRRSARWSLAILAVAVIVVLLLLVPSPFAVERPGPVVDALEGFTTDDGLVPVISVEGAETFETSGDLNVLSVSLHGSPEAPAGWLEVLGAVFDPAREVRPLSELYPEGVGVEERTAAGASMMRSSQQRAVAAALTELGEPVSSRLRVVGVSEDGPSEGELREDDVIRSADGVQVGTVSELGEVLAASRPGEAVRLGIERSGRPMEVEVVPVAVEAGGDPMLGVLVSGEYEFPFDVELSLGEIGGPSAGLILALAVYDTLTPGEMTGGISVSGTGTIDESGTVGPIGGLELKLWGASRAGTDLFLLPIGNCEDLPARIPSGMAVAPVATLSEAIEAIETAAAGGTPPGAERCSAEEFVRSAD